MSDPKAAYGFKAEAARYQAEAVAIEEGEQTAAMEAKGPRGDNR